MKKHHYRIQMTMILVLLGFLAGLFALGFRIWAGYRDTLIENQKEQLLITAQTLEKNISMSINGYLEDMELLVEVSRDKTEQDGARSNFYRHFLDNQMEFYADVLWGDGDGTLTDSVRGLQLENPVLLTQMNEDYSLWQYESQDARHYLVFQNRLEDGRIICFAVDEEAYYQELISDIHIGTNGYVVIKNSQGRIIMHPRREQWGIQVIEGRQELYPGLDYSSLEIMVEEQMEGKTGISEYYSYWWTKDELPRVKKVSAYCPARIGEDFWIVSTVIDYDDFYLPVAEGIHSLTMTIGAGLILFLLLAFCIGKLFWERQKADHEISDLRELNRQLEEMHRSEEIIAHQQRLQIMGTMTGGIAHEFNNFLTPIMGHAELLLMELPEDSEEYDSAMEIYEASEKAKEVIRQISSMSRKNVETVYKSISCEKFLSRAVKMIESVCPANVRLEKETEQSDVYILGNATQLNQVLLNICINSVHAIGRKEGLIRIRSRCEDREAVKRCTGEEPGAAWETYLHISIEDNGCGMDKDTLSQIFEPFFTTKKTGEGTGLGLALAEQIIRSHKGYLCAESQVGEGTMFHLFLPVTEQAEIPERADVPDKVRFVIADDNVKILEMLAKNLEKWKIHTATATNRNDLEKLLKEQETDVLLIDESLNDGPGIDYCMTLQGRYPQMIKILMVSRITREAAEAKQRQIIGAYIEKPVSVQSILEAVHACTKE